MKRNTRLTESFLGFLTTCLDASLSSIIQVKMQEKHHDKCIVGNIQIPRAIAAKSLVVHFTQKNSRLFSYSHCKDHNVMLGSQRAMMTDFLASRCFGLWKAPAKKPPIIICSTYPILRAIWLMDCLCCHIVSASCSYGAPRTASMFFSHTQCCTWHYHLGAHDKRLIHSNTMNTLESGSIYKESKLAFAKNKLCIFQ